MKLILAACLLGFVAASPLPYDAIDGLRSSMAQAKLIIHTDYGFNQVKHYLLNLKSDDPFAFDIRNFVESHSDEVLKKVLRGFFENVPTIAIEPIPGFKYPGLRELFGRVKGVLTTDEGVTAAKNYMVGILATTNDEVLQVVVGSVLALTDENIKHFFAVIFSDLEVQLFAPGYDVKSDLDEVTQQLKAILTTPEGIQQVRNRLNQVQSTNPTVILIRTVLSAMSDKSLIDLVKELGKNVKDIQLGDPQPDLLAVLTKGKDLLMGDEGKNHIREYLKNLQTTNFLIARVKSFIESRTNEEIQEALNHGWKEIFGEDAIVLLSN